jgi:hypothetical protein
LAGELDWRFSEEFFSGERIAGKVWFEAMTGYVNSHGITHYYEGDGVEGYLDWWTVAEYSCPFMDPTLMIGGRGVETTISTSGLVSSHPATIHYWEGGIAKTATTYGTWTGTPDYGSILSIENPVTVSATEQYHTTNVTSWTVTESATYSVTYHHQFKPVIFATTIGASLTSTNYATLSYSCDDLLATFDLWDGHSFDDWIDAGSTATLSNTSSASNETYRWFTETASWVINDASARTANYWEQFKPVISVIGLTETNYATLNYYYHGLPVTFELYDGHSFNDWVDAGSTATLSNPSSDANETHRWYCPGITSWVIDDASARAATYWEQFKVTITTTGLNPSHPATITFTQYGGINNSTTSASWGDWADAGSALSISSSVDSGEWSTTDTTSWTVDSPISVTVNYQHQQAIPLPAQGGLPAGVIAGIAVGSCAVVVGIYFAVKKWVWKR